jgi:ubiquinone/menaquinone biosynthesis C-methylase UbiE
MYNAKKHWNKSHLGHPKDRLPSNYAIDKEKSFPKKSVVCDLGGGDGADSIYFLEKGHTVYLYDISDEALKTAKINAEKLDFGDKFLLTQEVNLETDALPAQSDFFDVIYSRLSLHYFFSVRMAELFSEVQRVLKPGGKAYIVVKSPNDKAEMEYLKKSSNEIDPGVFKDEEGMIKTRFSVHEYKEILKESGIKNYKVTEYREVFGSQKTYVKSGADTLLYIEVVIQK